MDFDSIRLMLEALKEKIVTLKDAIKVDSKRERLSKLEKETPGNLYQKIKKYQRKNKH